VKSAIDIDASPANPLNPVMPVMGFLRSNYGPNLSGPPIVFDQDNLSQELRVESTGGVLEWTVGGYYQDFTDAQTSEVPIEFVDTQFEAGLPPAVRALVSDGIPGNNYYFDANPLDAEANWKSYSLFGDVTWHLTDQLKLFGGLRWTTEDVKLNYFRRNIRGPAAAPYFVPVDTDTVTLNLAALQANPIWAGFQQVTTFDRDASADDVSGRIGLSFSVTPDVNVYSTASRGFVGLGVNFGRNATLANSLIKPSVAEAFEVGVKSTWADGRLRANVALFHQKTDDLQTSRVIPGTINTETFNAGSLKSQGIEAELVWAATDQLMLELTASFVDTEIGDLVQPCFLGQTTAQGCVLDNNNDGTPDSQNVSGKSTVNTPELSYRAAARYELPLGTMPFNAFAKLSYSWQDEVNYKLTFDPMSRQGAYGLADVVVGIVDKDERYEVSLFGKNVAGEDFVLNLDNSSGSSGRQIARVTRDSESYYGIRARYNFR
jgi:iron complex outermembrane receptor protein